ncbi:MAG: zinc ribbon domain-containing protein [Dissulfuribacterales bacterium]
MPIYEYKCEKCNKIFESFVLSSRNKEGIRCPACGSNDVRKMLSSFSSVSAGPVSCSTRSTSSCGSSRFG